jgi:hypothetical protein
LFGRDPKGSAIALAHGTVRVWDLTRLERKVNE